MGGEGRHGINTPLSAPPPQVVVALAERAKHVPYRNSK